MTRSAAKLRQEVMALPDDQRADLAVALIESLDARADEGYDDAWASELASRLRSLEDGTMVRHPAVDVFSRVRTRLDRG